MATVYSLICWGGSTGKSVTASSATSRITLSNHGLRDGKGVQFTAGTLPTVSGTALALDTTYYVGVHSTSKFRLYYDEARTSQIMLTSNGSGLVLKGAYYQGLSDTSRWGARIYDGLASWRTARAAAALAVDVEVAEIGEDFTEYITAAFSTGTIPCGARIIESKVNGVRTAAFPAGQVSRGGVEYGYVFAVSGFTGGSTILQISGYDDVVDGITVKRVAFTGSGTLVGNGAVGSSFQNSVVIGGYSINSSNGQALSASGARSYTLNNVVVDAITGIGAANMTLGLVVAGNLVTDCQTGITGPVNFATNGRGFFYNNISVGNVSNWGGISPTGLEGATNNAGLAGEAWAVGGGSRITIATTDFADYANDDFTPAAGTSPQVDAGTLFFRVPLLDIAGAVRPSYKNGDPTEIDIGPYEYDWGFGPAPSPATLTLTDIQPGSDIVILEAGTTTERVNVDANAGTTYAYAYTTPGDVDIGVFKAGFVPFYIRGFTLDGVNATLPIAQAPDRAYSNP